MNKDTQFVVVGLGLLGGRYAMGLSGAGYRVAGIDTDPAAVQFALEKGYIQTGCTEDFAPLLKQADRLIVCLYPTAFVQWAQKWGSLLKPGCILTDVSGVKEGVVQQVQAALPEGVEFIASHPMAGRERSGVQNSALVDFAPANFIITPTEKNTPGGIAFARQLAEVLGFAHVCTLTPAEHDRMIGYVSQLAHAIAVSLMCASDNGHLAEYTGDSFRDLTRIARINGPMWAELFLWNRDNLIEEIDLFSSALQQLKADLQAGDRAGLEEMFALSTERRAAFDRQQESCPRQQEA